MTGHRLPLHRPFPGPGDGPIVALAPEDAGWDWTGLQVVEVVPGAVTSVRTGPSEMFVLPLSGSLAVTVRQEGAGSVSAPAEVTFELEGRTSVFAGATDFCYAGRDSVATLASVGGALVALPSARCSLPLPPAYGSAAEVPVEVRGAGSATRQVHNFGVPGVWEHAEKLVCCELLTPPGNWSSYPPHKHDASAPCPVVNEEIYYYRIAGRDQVTPSREGFGYHRTYTGPEHDEAGLVPLDELVEVRDHDVVLVPHGYHGPCIAAPGYPMYYLNVMAGPAPERRLSFCDDPAHAWVRDTWTTMRPDPRVPMTPGGPA